MNTEEMIYRVQCAVETTVDCVMDEFTELPENELTHENYLDVCDAVISTAQGILSNYGKYFKF